MKIFLMKTSSGDYEDYFEFIEGAFLSRENCQKAILEYNDRLHYKKTMAQVIKEIIAEVCEPLFDKYRDTDEFVYDTKEFIDAVREEIKDLPYEVSDDDITNIAYGGYELWELHDATMQEVEVLDVEQ